MKHDVMARKHPENIADRPAGVSRPDPVAAKAAAIKTGQAHPPTWKTVIKRVLVLAIAGAAIYLVLPSLIAVRGSWPRLSALSPIWFTAALAVELASFTCNFALQRLALRTGGLDCRLLAERDTIRAVLGQKWWQAVLLITGRLGFDFGCLLAALRATGAHPRPSLVLLAYSAAGIIALFPTPTAIGKA